MAADNDVVQSCEGLECLQALTQTSLQVLGQLNEGKDSPAQLDNGLQLLLHLQHLNSKVKDGSSNTCCVALFIEHQVSKPGQATVHASHVLQGRFLSCLRMKVLGKSFCWDSG